MQTSISLKAFRVSSRSSVPKRDTRCSPEIKCRTRGSLTGSLSPEFPPSPPLFSGKALWRRPMHLRGAARSTTSPRGRLPRGRPTPVEGWRAVGDDEGPSGGTAAATSNRSPGGGIVQCRHNSWRLALSVSPNEALEGRRPTAVPPSFWKDERMGEDRRQDRVRHAVPCCVLEPNLRSSHGGRVNIPPDSFRQRASIGGSGNPTRTTSLQMGLHVP